MGFYCQVLWEEEADLSIRFIVEPNCLNHCFIAGNPPDFSLLETVFIN